MKHGDKKFLLNHSEVQNLWSLRVIPCKTLIIAKCILSMAALFSYLVLTVIFIGSLHASLVIRDFK